MDEIIVGIDVGTTKICTLVGRVEEDDSIRILGVGIMPSDGIRRGVITDISAATQAITHSVEKAEQTSGVEVTAAIVSLAGAHVASINSRGVVAVSGETVDEYDIVRALDAARAVAIPHNREIIHIIQRGFVLDGQDGISMPIGMHGYRLEVEAHIITASAATVDNLRQCVGSAGVEVVQFVLNPLASADVVLTENDRQMGVAVCDIGGGTTDLALYVDGNVWHTMVLALGGNHITSDIAHGLRLPLAQAEQAKKDYGYAIRSEVGIEEHFTIRPFGEDKPIEISRKDMAHIIEARVEEIFNLVLQEIKRSGYDGLLPAGMVLTGGTSMLPGIRQMASNVLGMPVRLAKPENLLGLVDNLSSPAYSTSVGLLHWAADLQDEMIPTARGRPLFQLRKGDNSIDLEKLKDWFKRLLP
ncbi:MAG: cell division protein FtsA [Chloroflexi bacterium GWB2_49_20]|nr:MAG: cell division protein FtsA [Chloroflexi bacterium GWB2_49_20]OGN76136.1 MAG: cell division protein FtsA [Chloroflexi bacterium GWC2_49_37]OGN83522.1 MAG: cell division protein FtsA [Chloroflexi bacterium GWD2_49_16]HBG73926.1 cell division protein FtsA [Anaerolineae bacterium]HCC79494.1 cell division protein FtsA [Anaerolineae bacterium]